MNEYSFLVAIGAALLGGAMSPGPSFLVVAQNALAKSRAHGIATAVGTGLGAGLFALLAALGVTALIEKTPTLYIGIRLLGGCYLLYLAVRIWRAASHALVSTGSDKGNDGGLLTSCVSGLVVQISNPKTIFIIASIFSAVMPSQPPANTAFYVTLIAFLIDFAWYAVVAVSLSYSKSRDFYQAAKVYFDRFAACLLLLLSLKLLLEVGRVA